LVGIQNFDLTSDSLVIQFSERFTGVETQQLSVKFESGSTNISDIQFVSSDVPLNDIIEYAKDSNDLRFLVIEMRARLANYRQRRVHLQELSSKFHLDYSLDEQHVIFTLPLGVVATVQLTHDYPQPWSPLRIIALDGVNGWHKEELQGVMNDVNGCHFHNLVKLASHLLDCLKQIDHTKTPKIILQGKLDAKGRHKT